MAPRSRLFTLLACCMLAAAACTSHPLSAIEFTTFVEVRDEIPQVEAPETPLDILFIVDNSGSMEEEQTNLANNFGAFIDLVLATPADFRIAIISTDMADPNESGRFLAKPGNPKIISRATGDSTELKRVFGENVRLGTMGDGFEKGLQAMETALSAPLINNENANFLRGDALLAVILISDEEDCSHPPGVIPEFDGDECVRNLDRMYPTSRYIDFLTGLKGGDAGKVLFAAITGPEIPTSTPRPTCSTNGQCSSGRCSDGRCCPTNPTFTSCQTNDDCVGQAGTSCVGRRCLPTIPSATGRPYAPRSCSCFAAGTGLAEPGTRYIDLVKAFGANGVYASICAADWSQSLADIGGAAASLVCKFPLSKNDAADTIGGKTNPNILPDASRDIIVKINDQEVPSSGWDYNCPEPATQYKYGSISFDSATCPPFNSTVQFFYQPAAAAFRACTSQGDCQANERCGNCGYCERTP